jgi:hypothetical protein
MRRVCSTCFSTRWQAVRRVGGAFILLAAAALALSAGPALALSEIQRGNVPSPATPPNSPDHGTIEQQPLPPLDQVPIPDAANPSTPAAPAEPDDEGEPGQATEPDDEPDGPVPEVMYDLGQLPEPVRRMHSLLVEAAKSGDIEKLRPLLDTGENATQLSFGGVDGDPIAYLKDISADKQGGEMLAILEEVLTAGYVHMDAGTPNEMYIWPYFFAVPLDKLSAAQRVELFKIVTASEYDDMVTYGSYVFFRAGITPDGRWSFFVQGD